MRVLLTDVEVIKHKLVQLSRMEVLNSQQCHD